MGCGGDRKRNSLSKKLVKYQASLANGRAGSGQEGREGSARRTEAHRDGGDGKKGNRDRNRVGQSNGVDIIICLSLTRPCNPNCDGTHRLEEKRCTGRATDRVGDGDGGGGGEGGDEGGATGEHRGSLVVPHLLGTLQPHLVEARAWRRHRPLHPRSHICCTRPSRYIVAQHVAADAQSHKGGAGSRRKEVAGHHVVGRTQGHFLEHHVVGRQVVRCRIQEEEAPPPVAKTRNGG